MVDRREIRRLTLIALAFSIVAQALWLSAVYTYDPVFFRWIAPRELPVALLVLLTFGLSFDPALVMYWKFLNTLLGVCTVVNVAALAALLENTSAEFLTFLVVIFGSSILLPWGALWQAVFNFACLASYFGSVIYIGSFAAAAPVRLGGMLVAVVLSEIAAGLQFSRRRDTYRDVERANSAEKRAAAIVEMMQSTVLAIAETSDLASAFRLTLRRVCEASGWILGQAWVPRDDGKALEWAATWTSSLSGVEEFARLSQHAAFSFGEGLPGQVWASRKPAWIPYLSQGGNFHRSQLAMMVGFTSAMAVPVMEGNNVVAVLEFYAFRPKPADEAIIDIIAAVAAQLGALVQRKQAEELLRTSETQAKGLLVEARDAALQSSRLKSAFLANLSHEIRTPLHAILTYSTLLSRHPSIRGDLNQKRFLGGIDRASHRLKDTIDAILDFAKFESGTFEAKPVVVDLVALIDGQIEEFRGQARQKNLDLEFRGNDARAFVVFDEYCLTHALINLLHNAVKFTDQGSVSATLSRDESSLLQLKIEDTGIGIGNAYLARMFQPFTQEQSGYERPFEGSGLGLALAKRYVELNGAELDVRSEKGKGSSFIIRFPSRIEIGAPPRVESAPTPGNGQSKVSA